MSEERKQEQGNSRKEIVMENFVSFELAKKLKEKGFKGKCLKYYNIHSHILCSNAHLYTNYGFETIAILEDFMKSYNSQKRELCIDAPGISQVLKWLRKEKGIHIELTASAFGYSYIISKTPDFGGTDIKFSEFDDPNDGGAWDDYDDCALAAIDYVLDNLI